MASDHQRTGDDYTGDAARLIADIDLSILGSNYFSEYEALVRAEYAGVPYAVYARGRRDFLEKFLALRGGQIFQTDVFRDRYEVQAQENIAELLEKLCVPAS